MTLLHTLQKWSTGGVLWNTDALTLLASLPDESVQLVLTDPPYGSTNAAWDKAIDTSKFLHEIKRILKPNGCACIFSGQKFTIQLCAADISFFRYKYVWSKTTACGFLNANRAPLRRHEDICVFYKRPPLYFPQKTKGTPYGKSGFVINGQLYQNIRRAHKKYDGWRYPTDVIEFSAVPRSQMVHSCQKPVELLQFLIKTYSAAGDLVLDPFAGSGSTAVACVETGRTFLGCELDGDIYQAAASRIDAVCRTEAAV